MGLAHAAHAGNPRQQPSQSSPELTKAQRQEYERKGCGPEMRHVVEVDRKNPFPPAPVEGKALIFVVRPTKFGDLYQTKLSIDGEWVGVNRGDTYFAVHVSPGEHFFCSTAENRSVLRLEVEAGKTYYLQQKIRSGWLKATNILVLLDEAAGLEALSKTNKSVFAPRQ